MIMSTTATQQEHTASDAPNTTFIALPNPTNRNTVSLRFEIDDARDSLGVKTVSDIPISSETRAGYPEGAQFYLICVALALCLSLGGLDGNIVATAVPSITDVSPPLIQDPPACSPDRRTTISGDRVALNKRSASQRTRNTQCSWDSIIWAVSRVAMVPSDTPSYVWSPTAVRS